MDNRSMIMILLAFIVLAVLGYYFFIHGKSKMPSFNQRMALFGKTIKSLMR